MAPLYTYYLKSNVLTNRIHLVTMYIVIKYQKRKEYLLLPMIFFPIILGKCINMVKNYGIDKNSPSAAYEFFE